MALVRQMAPAEHATMRFEADRAAASFPQGTTVQGVDPKKAYEQYQRSF